MVAYYTLIPSERQGHRLVQKHLVVPAKCVFSHPTSLIVAKVKWNAGKLSLRVGFIVESSRAELKKLVILREIC